MFWLPRATPGKHHSHHAQVRDMQLLQPPRFDFRNLTRDLDDVVKPTRSHDADGTCVPLHARDFLMMTWQIYSKDNCLVLQRLELCTSREGPCKVNSGSTNRRGGSSGKRHNFIVQSSLELRRRRSSCGANSKSVIPGLSEFELRSASAKHPCPNRDNVLFPAAHRTAPDVSSTLPPNNLEVPHCKNRKC